MRHTRILAGALVGLSIQATAQTFSCSATSSDGNEFVPSKGALHVLEDSYSRYIYQWVYWHQLSRLNFLKRWGATYEPDVIFYNYNGQAYGLAPSGYWASDLPYAYVDTQFQDPNTEKAVTIGSGDSTSLVPGRWYYTVTRMTSGPNAGPTSYVKASSQRGAQAPDGCTSTWCSFGCSEQPNNLQTIPFTHHFVPPGCRTWYWNYNITTITGC